ncbi:hypothetical protein MN608_04365 [Microdochium nivale]|nr:hypothetical protein MN608_04365 [Microdochium nivale]
MELVDGAVTRLNEVGFPIELEVPLSTYTQTGGYDFAFDVVFATRWRPRRSRDCDSSDDWRSDVVLNYEERKRHQRVRSPEAAPKRQLDTVQGQLAKSHTKRQQPCFTLSDVQAHAGVHSQRVTPSVNNETSETAISYPPHGHQDMHAQKTPELPNIINNIGTSNLSDTAGAVLTETTARSNEQENDCITDIFLKVIDEVFSRFDQRLEHLDVLENIDFQGLLD